MKKNLPEIALIILFILSGFVGIAQNGFTFSGKITSAAHGYPVQNATINIKGSSIRTISKKEGSFNIHVNKWYDSLEVSCIGFDANTVLLVKGDTAKLFIVLKEKVGSLQEVVVGISKKPGKTFIEKVLERKTYNNPSKFAGYSFQRYTRNELDIDNIDFKKVKGKGLKSLMLKTYEGLDASAAADKELPIYFTELLANAYHSLSPKIDRENIIAKKDLGLETDGMLRKLDKYYFNFNVYDDWIPLFEQMFASPLNTDGEKYYNYFLGDQLAENGDTIQQVRFTPIHLYEKAFNGTMWINIRSLAVETINMKLAKTANLNFINNINYSEEYKQVYDSAQGLMVYMPYKFSSEVKFNGGLALLGIPAPDNKNNLRFIIKNTTITDKIKLNKGDGLILSTSEIKKEQTTDWAKSEKFWAENRPDSLSSHEKNIYRMVDSLKVNVRFQRDIKLIAFAGSGYWDFGKYFRMGPYSSFISKNRIEGWRLRMGFWTMPAINKKINVFGYAAYGLKDKKLKGAIGMKYVWNEARWTKTTLSYSSDFDFIIDQVDEADKDNIINSFLRKKVPFSRMYIKQALLKHEQYLSPNFSAKLSLDYKELNPVFNFKYRPINPVIDRPYDNIFRNKLPVAEATIGIRYAHNERTTMLNYDKIRLGTFSPVLYANYTFGVEIGNSQFNFQKFTLGIEQRLRLPPKALFFYKLEAGKVFGTIPYLLLNIPIGNEYYVASKYQFNTMTPYEFAEDKFVSLHSRLHFGGTLFDKVPLLQKLGWRERCSYNAYWGTMNKQNSDYNKNSNFNLIHNTPFMEASVGVENIFHLISIDYYRRLNYLTNPFAKKGGLFLGLSLLF